MSKQPGRSPAQPILQHFGLLFGTQAPSRHWNPHPRAPRLPCFTPEDPESSQGSALQNHHVRRGFAKLLCSWEKGVWREINEICKVLIKVMKIEKKKKLQNQKNTTVISKTSLFSLLLVLTQTPGKIPAVAQATLSPTSLKWLKVRK